MSRDEAKSRGFLGEAGGGLLGAWLGHKLGKKQVRLLLSLCKLPDSALPSCLADSGRAISWAVGATVHLQPD